jgi:hypothetical protein
MNDRLVYLNNELLRLSQALTALANALEREKLSSAMIRSERDDLVAALADSNRQMAAMIEAVRELKRRQQRRGEVVLVDFQRSRIH